MRALLAAGEDVNAASTGGQTSLILASIFGHEEIAALLLEAGADASIRDERGLNAAEWAIRRGFPNVAQILTNSAPRVTVPPQRAPRRVAEPDPPPVEAERETPVTPRMTGAAAAILRTRAAASLGKIEKASPETEPSDPFEEVVFRGKEVAESDAVAPTAIIDETLDARDVETDTDEATLPHEQAVQLEIDQTLELSEHQRVPPVLQVEEPRPPQVQVSASARPPATLFTQPAASSSGQPLLWVLVVITLGASAYGAYRLNSYFSRPETGPATNTIVTAAAPASSPLPTPAETISAPAIAEKFPVTGGPLAGTEVVLPSPAYPAAAKRRNLSGTVTITVRVNRAGKVISWRSDDGEPVLRAAALRAARRSRFDPAKLPGKGEVVGTITYRFVNE